jgi:hypothetical protein
MQNLIRAFLVLCFCCCAPSAWAHYLWVTVEGEGGEYGSAKIYFEEGPSAGDGHYLDHFTGSSKTWFRTLERIEARLIPTSELRDGEKRWLAAKLPGAAPRGVDCYGKFGVYRYGNTPVLLHYYARCLDVTSHEALHELSRADHMDLDIALHDHEDKVDLQVLWRGKPAGGRMIYIRGPQRFRKNLVTDEDGKAQFTPVSPGRYTFRTSVEQATAGREGDEQYDLIRHNGTLVVNLPLAQ